jgi:hypothetical protein
MAMEALHRANGLVLFDRNYRYVDLNGEQGKWTHRFSRKSRWESGEREMLNDGSTTGGELFHSYENFIHE